MLGFWQEKGAAEAFEKLLAAVQIKAAVIRDGEEKEIPVEEIVPGDIKVAGVLNAESPLAKRTNSLWMGTSVGSLHRKGN